MITTTHTRAADIGSTRRSDPSFDNNAQYYQNKFSNSISLSTAFRILVLIFNQKNTK